MIEARNSNTLLHNKTQTSENLKKKENWKGIEKRKGKNFGE